MGLGSDSLTLVRVVGLSFIGCAQADGVGDASRIVYPRNEGGQDSRIEDAASASEGSVSEDAETDAPQRGPSCGDNIRNQDETDVDCGGTSCQPCGYCDTCDEPNGCPEPLACSDGRCVYYRNVTIDWLKNCVVRDSGDFSTAVVVTGFPTGIVEISATGGGGTPWSVSVHDPPARGYAYRVTCDPLETMQLSTPEGVYYATPDEAFEAVEVSSIQVSHPGGDITCYQPDVGCSDNSGSLSFSIESVCSANQ